MKKALFFGTFNPVHNGHLMIANYILNNKDVDEVIFVVSPNAPFKDTKGQLISFEDRCSMLELAIENVNGMSVSRIEKTLEQPTYTYKTVKKLIEEDKDSEYVLIIGADNLKEIHSWFKVRDLLKTCDVFVILRNDICCGTYICELHWDFDDIKGIEIINDCPFCSMSSTFVRDQLSYGKDISFYVPEKVRDYIKEKKLY